LGSIILAKFLKYNSLEKLKIFLRIDEVVLLIPC